MCPICDTASHSKKEYKENLPLTHKKIDYSGRKTPDGYHYEMVRCKNCSLLYASSIYEREITDKLYENSGFIYDEELKGLKKTYEHCLIQAENLIIQKELLTLTI